MGYTPIKGGAAAVRAAARLVQHRAANGAGGAAHAAETGAARQTGQTSGGLVRQVHRGLGAAVDRIMGEGGLYAPELAALAIAQAEGDMDEAALLLRAYRSTLPRLGYARAVSGRDMRVVRRISAAFKDVPGGQLLGRTRDYTQRLLDFSLLEGMADEGRSARPEGNEGTKSLPRAERADEQPALRALSGAEGSAGKGRRTADEAGAGVNGHAPNGHVPGGEGSDGEARDVEGFTWPVFPKVSDTLRGVGSMAPLPEVGEDEDEGVAPFDVTRESLRFPVTRPAWLQSLARGETSAMVCLAYSNLRGYGYADHGTIGEVRVGDLPLRVTHPLTGRPVAVGWYRATECEMFGPEGDKPVTGARGRMLPHFGLSYGLVIGQNERKAIAMSVLDSALQASELAAAEGGDVAPSNDQEMVLSHVDGIESTGFVEHLKLPHYVTFGSQIRTQVSPRREVMLAAGRALAEMESDDGDDC